MNKFEAVYKRGNIEKNVVIERIFDDKGFKWIVIDDKGRKSVKQETIRRWYEIGEEIIEKPAAAENKEIKAAEDRCIKKDGSVRTDKFKPKLDADQVLAIREAFAAGERKSALAKQYEVSFRTITCIIERLMWKEI